MDFIEDYPKLEPAQKDHFQSVVTRLLSGAVLTPGSPLKVDPDWRFSERYRDLIDSYLRLGGWRFDIDLGLRMARAVHEGGTQRVRFTKLESLVLCALRLYYHEQMRLGYGPRALRDFGRRNPRAIDSGGQTGCAVVAKAAGSRATRWFGLTVDSKPKIMSWWWSRLSWRRSSRRTGSMRSSNGSGITRARTRNSTVKKALLGHSLYWMKRSPGNEATGGGTADPVVSLPGPRVSDRG